MAVGESVLLPVMGSVIEGMQIISQTKMQTMMQTILNKLGININL